VGLGDALRHPPHPSPLRVLHLDIETSPNLGYVWSLWKQNIGLNQLVESGHVLCWAAKWHGERKVHFASDYHDGHDAMIAKAYELVDEADAIVTYNGRAFDLKWLRSEFVLAGLTPPAPHKDVDLLTIVRRQFKFPSNKLEYVAQALLGESKVQHAGFELWTGCMAGNAKAWAQMRAYNRQDVLLTERLYDRLLPWIPNHPHHGLYHEAHLSVCQNCGSKDLERRGYAYTNLGRYQRFRCNGCGAWGRGRHVDRQIGIRAS
jgi:DNA polymerase elongation subunit (family B)